MRASAVSGCTPAAAAAAPLQVGRARPARCSGLTKRLPFAQFVSRTVCRIVRECRGARRPGCQMCISRARAPSQQAVCGGRQQLVCVMLPAAPSLPGTPLMHSEAQLVAPCTITALARGVQAHAAHWGAEDSGGWSGSHSEHDESTRGQQWMDGRGKEEGTIGRKYKDVWSRSTHAEERRCGASERSWLLRCC